MKQAIVTGASSGIGLALSQFLTAEGYRVHGLARDFSKTEFTHPAFNPIVCDVRDIDVLQETAKAILEDAGSLHLLINNAGVAYFAPYETLSAGQVAEMADTNFRAPLLLTNLCLKALKESQGTIINMSSITAEIRSPWGSAYAGTKAGLVHFGENLFDEVRKSGVAVVSILPDLTSTPFYDHLSFEPGEAPEAHLTPQDVVKAVATVLDQRPDTAVTKLVIRPQKLSINKKKRRT